MKTLALLVTLLFAVFNACERPPQGKEIIRNSTGPTDRSKTGLEFESSPDAASAPFELQFIDTMTAHHQNAIEMAQLVSTRAQHPELKEFAKKMIADQQKEIAQIRELRSKLFGEAAPAINMDMPGMRDGMKETDLAKLDLLKANKFDIEFIRQMMPNQEGAAAMAKYALSQETNAEIKTLSEAIVVSRTAEIEQMKQWLAEWSK